MKINVLNRFKLFQTGEVTKTVEVTINGDVVTLNIPDDETFVSIPGNPDVRVVEEKTPEVCMLHR